MDRVGLTNENVVVRRVFVKRTQTRCVIRSISCFFTCLGIISVAVYFGTRNSDSKSHSTNVNDGYWTDSPGYAECDSWSFEQPRKVKLHGPKWLKTMEKKMSNSNKSCCDFYKRACWGWEKQNNLSDKDGWLDEFTIAGRKVMRTIKSHFARGNLSGNAEKKAKIFFDSCRLTSRSNRREIIRRFKRLISQTNTTDLTKLFSTIHSYNAWPMFKVTARPDPRNVKVNKLTISMGDSPLKNFEEREPTRMISASLLDKLHDRSEIADKLRDSIKTDKKLKEAVSEIEDIFKIRLIDGRKRRKRNVNAFSPESQDGVDSLTSSSIDQIVKTHTAINTLIFKFFFGLSDISYKDPYCFEFLQDCEETKSQARKAADDLLDLEIQLIKAMTKYPKTEYKTLNYDILTLRELQAGCSMINWRLYFRELFGEDISISEEFIVFSKKNLFSSCDTVALNMTHDLTFRRYLLVSLIKTSIDHFDIGILLDDEKWFDIASSFTKDHWFDCMAYTQKFLGLATSSVFVRNTPSKDHIDEILDINVTMKVQEILNYVKKAFREKILRKPWLDKSTITAALKKLDFMVDKVGYPKYIMNRTFRDHYYDKLFIATNYYRNVMHSQKFLVKQIWKDLSMPADRNKWGMVPSQVNAMHNALRNDMTVTLAIMTPPFFDPERPISLNFGSLGTIIGHELTHAFGTAVGQYYDYEGAAKNWMTRSSEAALVQRSKCFVRQYEDYDIDEYQISGNLTLEENIADNGGLRAAYQAYLLWKKDNLDLNHNFSKIFTENHFKEEELFFLSFAQMYCSKYSDSSAALEVTKSHSPGPLRVKGTLSNMKEFSSTFQCSKGQTYYRQQKCLVW